MYNLLYVFSLTGPEAGDRLMCFTLKHLGDFILFFILCHPSLTLSSLSLRNLMYASYLYVDVCWREGSASVTEFFPKTSWIVCYICYPKTYEGSGKYVIIFYER